MEEERAPQNLEYKVLPNDLGTLSTIVPSKMNRKYDGRRKPLRSESSHVERQMVGG
jgi:hypothetical protein